MARLNAVKKGGGGKKSALKQLRTALLSSGITGAASQISKRDRKRGVHKKTDVRRSKLRAIQTALNPFELQVNRKKLDVLGLKRKDDVVNVAVARQRAVEKRRETLGKQRQQRAHTSAVVDQRIGENDPTMDPEERMLRRFTAERQRRAGGDVFNLDDDVEGGITSLTHFGQSIAEIEKFEQPAGAADDNYDDTPQAMEAADHFGGFDERKKTKAEVMQEIIAKSKQHKYERQQLREQDDDTRR
ncbi:nucleolar complex protein 14, partial [Coemansia sp. RSA 2705]